MDSRIDNLFHYASCFSSNESVPIVTGDCHILHLFRSHEAKSRHHMSSVSRSRIKIIYSAGRLKTSTPSVRQHATTRSVVDHGV